MNTSKRILSTILMIAAVLCAFSAAFFTLRDRIQAQHSQAVLEEMRSEAASVFTENSSENSMSEAVDTADTEVPTQETEPVSTEEEAVTPTESVSPALPNPYAESFLQNEDMAAWITIPDTSIDYPVMWTPRDENYYLYRAFDGSEDKNGSLILDTDSCLNPLSTNLIIHGHNMKSGAMFGNLTDYENFSYFQDHRYISLYTEECERRYEVLAVFRSQVYRKSDTVFKFYKFFQADTVEEFEDFYQNIKDLSLYDTGVTAEFGDHFLTLSTCVYHVENGRFVVVAKEIDSGDAYLPLQEYATTNTN